MIHCNFFSPLVSSVLWRGNLPLNQLYKQQVIIKKITHITGSLELFIYIVLPAKLDFYDDFYVIVFFVAVEDRGRMIEKEEEEGITDKSVEMIEA